jgi:hypothetical protein
MEVSDELMRCWRQLKSVRCVVSLHHRVKHACSVVRKNNFEKTHLTFCANKAWALYIKTASSHYFLPALITGISNSFTIHRFHWSEKKCCVGHDSQEQTIHSTVTTLKGQGLPEERLEGAAQVNLQTSQRWAWRHPGAD